MVIELRHKSQITLPKDIVIKLGLEIGDHLEINENNGVITLTPVMIYPKEVVKALHEEVETLKEDIKSGKQTTFNNIDSLLKKLDS